MRKIYKIDLNQIENERRGFMEVVIIVILTGFLLNFLATLIFDIFKSLSSIATMVIVIILLVFLFIGYLFAVLIKPVKIQNSIPVVIFFDEVRNTISIPVEIHAPQPIQEGNYHDIGARVSFPVLCRSFFDNYKKGCSSEYPPQNQMELIKILTELIQCILLNQYINQHTITWNPFTNEVIGPFDVGTGFDLPEETIEPSTLKESANNRFMTDKGLPMKIPQKSKIKFLSHNQIILENPLFKGSIKIFPRTSNNLGTWKISYGLSTSWYRDLSSDFSNTSAFLFEINMDFEIKASIWRFFKEEWFPEKIRPKIKLNDISTWVNNWIESSMLFFDWVDENMNNLPKEEKARLINKNSSRYKTYSGIIF